MARHVYRCPLRWSDMDAFGHVNNVAYFCYLPETRVLHIKAAALTFASVIRDADHVYAEGSTGLAPFDLAAGRPPADHQEGTRILRTVPGAGRFPGAAMTEVVEETSIVKLVVADGVGTIRLDRPPVNAMCGGERIFSAGGDIKEMAATGHPGMVGRAHGEAAEAGGRLVRCEEGGEQGAFDVQARVKIGGQAAVDGFLGRAHSATDAANSRLFAGLRRAHSRLFVVVDTPFTARSAATCAGRG